MAIVLSTFFIVFPFESGYFWFCLSRLCVKLSFPVLFHPDIGGGDDEQCDKRRGGQAKDYYQGQGALDF